MTFYHPKHYAELRKLQAASIKLQAASHKLQATSDKRQAASYKHQAPSDSRKDSKAASDKQQAS